MSRPKSVSCLPLRVERVQLLEDVLHLLDGGHEVGNSEVVSAGLLLEAASGNSHDTGLVYQVHAVEVVGLTALGMGLIDELLREVDAGEPVHRAFDLSACNVLHGAEGVAEQASLGSESFVELSMLGVVERHSLI